MALRKIILPRDVVGHIAGEDCCPFHPTARVMNHIAESAQEMGMKGHLVLNPTPDAIIVVGDAAKGFDLTTARVYAENWERIFKPSD